MNSHTLRSTLGILGAILGLGILNTPAWSADTARKGAPKSQRDNNVKFNDVAITKGERQSPGDTPTGQGLLNNKNPELNITSPRDAASGQATGISWSGYDGDDVEKSAAKGQASRSPTGQNATGGTIPVYWGEGMPNKANPAPTNGIMVCNGGPCFNPVDTSRSAPASNPGAPKPVIGDILQGTNIRQKPPGQATGIVSPRDPASGQATGQFKEGGVNDMTHIVSPRDSQSGLPQGIDSPRDSASGLATGK